MYFITTICSNCKKKMGTKPTSTKTEPGLDISHGMCEECIRILYPELADDILKEMSEEGGV